MVMNISNALADAAVAVSASVVQVRARQRAASGLVYADGIVVTMGRVLGRDEQPEVRTPDGRILPAELAGWDPGTRLAALRVAGLGAPPLAPASLPRVGHLTLAVARSWDR